MSMMRPALAGAAVNAAAAVLKINALQLMFPQGEIRTLESVSDVDGSEPMARSAGWISFLQQRWPVYCLSDQLELLDKVPPSRRTCALLALENGYMGIMCDDVSIMKQLTGRRYEIPIAMKLEDTPIQGLLVDNSGLLCASGANQLAAYVAHLIEMQKD